MLHVRKAELAEVADERDIDVAKSETPLSVRNEGNVLFNDALNTFYLLLYGVEHMVKDHSDSERKPAAATSATLSDWELGNRINVSISN